MELTEQETIISFDESSKIAYIYTSSNLRAKMLIGQGINPVKVSKHKRRITGWFFELPKYSVVLKPYNRAIRIGGRKNNSEALGKQKSCSMKGYYKE